MENKLLLQGNCIEKMKELDDNSVDAIVTDPPYELGFMGKKWDASGIAYDVEMWKEALRVLKPGGHLLSFGGTRTYHRMTVAIEDAGFEIRDMLEWIYASGFPKSQNVGKAYDKKMGNEREWVSKNPNKASEEAERASAGKCQSGRTTHPDITKGNSQWEGFGTALKPAHEPIVLARKPLSEKTIVENCIKHGTGALDIDGCRIPTKWEDEEGYRPDYKNHKHKTNVYQGNSLLKSKTKYNENRYNQGRFPANLLVTDDALNDGEITKTGNVGEYKRKNTNSYSGFMPEENTSYHTGDSGSKSRFFDIDVWAEKHGLIQTPKASKSERGKDNNHPTVKPIHIMHWLIRLVSKEGDTVLDPFMGSGTTGVACKQLDRNFIGIELNEEYIEIAEARIKKAENPAGLVEHDFWK